MINNMLLPLEYKKEFIDFSRINIEFHTKHKKFRINNIWLDEINEDFFHDSINEFVEGLKVILISNNNNLLIVDEILTILQHNINWFESNNIQNFSTFSSYLNKVKNVDFEIEYEVSEIYTIDKVLNYKFNGGPEVDNIIYCLFAHKDRTNNYKESIDFENVKLFFFLNQFYKSLVYFEEKINVLKNAVQVYGVTDLSHYFSETKSPENKCNIMLDKISSAFLFKLLIEADLIYMDADKYKSESKIKKFAETYFNYTDSKLGIKPLTDFTKEYTKVKNKERSNKQLDVLNKLNDYIKTKRGYLN
jgi:hypothetical protein